MKTINPSHQTINIILTIGNSDVQTNNKHFFEQKNINVRENRYNSKTYLIPSPFINGKKILQNFDNYYPHLLFPIVDNVLKFIQKEHPSNPLQIFLISTNQNNQEYKNTDTYYFAKIIEKHINKKYNITDIKHTVIKADNIAHYDTMYEWFFNQFKKSTKNIDGHIYLVPQGGVDAINFNLMMFVITKYPNIHQLAVDEKTGKVSILSFPQKFIFQSFISPLLKTYQYESILNLEFVNQSTKKIIQTFLNTIYNTSNNLTNSNIPNNSNSQKNDIPPHIKTFLETEIKPFADELKIILNKNKIQIVILLIQTYIEKFIENNLINILKNEYDFNFEEPLDFYNEWKIKKIPSSLLPEWKENAKKIFQKDQKKYNPEKKDTGLKMDTFNHTVGYYLLLSHPSFQDKDKIKILYNFYYSKTQKIRNNFAHKGSFDFSKQYEYSKIIKDFFNLINQNPELLQTKIDTFNSHLEKLFLQ
jgi:hypothetical protein